MTRPSPASIAQAWRFVKVGAVNTGFGYLLYALMVAIGLQLFVAQAAATVIAIAFNYISYSQYVFTNTYPSKMRFILSYALSYVVNVAALAGSTLILSSAYLAGLLATLVTATINFAVLRRYVFLSRSGQIDAGEAWPSRPTAVGEAVDGTLQG